MNILVVFTGGTIGSTCQDGFIGTDSAKSFQLIEAYRKNSNTEVTFSSSEPYRILSENITFEDYPRLVSAVQQGIQEHYDGIIVTHGSDTLQYSAALLSYVFGRTEIPILLVASNYVLDDPRANGLTNFSCAVDFICAKMGKGVFVAYKNPDAPCEVHRGELTIAYDIYSDRLRSLEDFTYGTFEQHSFFMNIRYHDIIEVKSHAIGKFTDQRGAILLVEAAPGIHYPELTSQVKAVIHRTYHSGTICAVSPDLGLFMKRARELEIPVFIVGNTLGPDYDSCKIYQELGMIQVPKVSPIAFYMKLWLALTNQMDLIEAATVNWVGEYLEEAN